MKKILYISLWSILFVALVFTMGFASRTHADRICEKVDIRIKQKNDDQFLKEASISKLLADKGIHPKGK